MACEDCNPCSDSWSAGIKMGAAIPVALVCNVAGETDINDVELVPECYQEVDNPDNKWTRVTVLTYVAGVQQAPTFVWITPDGTVQESGPGGAYERCEDQCPIVIGLLCYVDNGSVVRVVAYTDSCTNPPEVTYYELISGEQVTDQVIIDQLSTCVPDSITPIKLCERIPVAGDIDVLTFDDADNRVVKLNGTTGSVIDSHLPDPAIDWANGSVYDPNTNNYYLLDTVTNEWHQYDASNIGDGSTNLGVFGGDPIVGNLSFGSFDITNNLGYIGRNEETRYSIDFGAGTVTALPVFSGSPVGQAPSSLSITNTGIHYVTVIPTPVGGNTRIYTADKATGVMTFVNEITGPSINGSSFDINTDTGWYGGDADTDIFYRWENEDGSDIQQISTGITIRTMEVTEASIEYDCTPFIRYFHKNEANVVTIQDHGLDGQPITVNEIFVSSCELCDSQEPEAECNNPGPKLCYEETESVDMLGGTWTEQLPTQITHTSFPAIPPNFSVRFQNPTGTVLFAQNLDFADIQGNGTFEIRFSRALASGEPFIMTVRDLDPAETLTFAVPPDTTVGMGDGLTGTFTWNDGSLIAPSDGSILIATVNSVDNIGVDFVDEAIFSAESGEVIPFYDCDGALVEYRDAATDEVLDDPNIVPCLEPNDCDNPSWTRDCIVTWSEILCDRVDTVQGLDLFTFAEPDQEVQKLNGLTGAVEDSHLPNPAVDWGHGTVYDGENNLYYLYDNNSGDWHRYDGSNLAAGSTNMGVFGGDPIVGTLTFGAFDVTSGWGYVGTTGTRYRIDFDAQVITSLPAHTTDGVTNIGQLSSLSITDQGVHYLTAFGPGATTDFYSVDVVTGISTLIGNEPIVLNGADFDLDTLTGFYGAGQGNLHRWTQPDGSDFQIIASAPQTGTLAVGNASIITDRTEFQRVYHKNIITGVVDIQDHDLDGDPYEVDGVAESCPQEIELPCPTKSVTEVCYETERLIDAEITLHGGAWTIVGPNQATQTFELPDGSNVNFTLTRAVGGSEVSQGPVINGIETLNLTTPTNGPSTWGLVWDVPLTGRFTMLFDDFDNDGGVTINEQLLVIGPQAPDNAGDYQGNILNERVTFVWDTSLIGGTNVTFQIDNAGVQIADSINIAPITMTVPVEFVGPYPALASMDCNDIVTYYDANTLEVLEDPAIVPCESLNVHWAERLCDRIDTITGLDLFFFNDANQEVQRVNAFSGAVEDSHAPDPAIDWGHGTVFDASGGATGYYYLYDNTAGEWHRYEAGNISAGSVNLGPFGGDPIVGSLTFGAFDPTTGLGYVGFVEQTRYEVDFNTATITAVPGFTGFTGAPSSLSVTETGLHYMTGLLAGAHTILHTVDVATGVCTPTGNFINIGLNGADYDQDTLSGFYGIGNNNLYHWTELNGSDLEVLTPAVFSGTLAVGNTVVNTERVEFQRVYHKDLISGEVTRQDHDLEGADYEIQGVVERCQPSCDDPLYVQQCIETWSKLLRDENCVVFNRVYHKTLEGVVTYQDHDLSGNLYTPVGEVGVGVNCYDVESHIVEIVSGGTWTPASVPANHVLTGLSMNVIIEAVDSSITDADGNIVTNIPAGLSMSWNVSQDHNTLVPPQSISAGTGGRMILNMTVRDET